ncbi:response regulator transcription factor [Paenibacillus ferrarius]|uniref:response regulator transcription factor n=1 Tax=Paenibacillus ferrarius TaxID=1469647 RepID=UPI003D2AE801
MMNLLVVDDEKFAVKGITVGIDWSDMAIGGIYEALDVEEAKRILSTQRIDIMISDIEMPGANGLQLQEWVRANSAHTETIFLTGHANFEYAQQAVRLGSFDYVLKPVDHDRLHQIVGSAMEKIRADQEQQEFHETYKTYYQHWVSELPAIVERFWQELLGGKIPANPERLLRHFQMYELPLQLRSTILPILISVEHWKEALNARDEEIMEYAIRKAAAELIVAEQQGCVIQENGSTLVLLYDAEARLSQQEVKMRCEGFIAACNRYFQCSLSCYMGSYTALTDVAVRVADLWQAERNNVTRSNCVLVEAESADGASGRKREAPSFGDWSVLLEAGKKEELIQRIQETIARYQGEEIGSETVEAFYYGLLHLVYQVCHKKGLAVHDLLPPQELQDYAGATRSLHQLQHWAIRVAGSCCDYMNEHLKDVSAVTMRVCQYIETHLHEELSREELAAAVYLNPAYLSRLFKKETGLSISEFSLKVRMERAKKLLAESNDKVSAVAEQTGYSHFSFFAKMFKKYTGLSPQEYRKSFQG